MRYYMLALKIVVREVGFKSPDGSDTPLTCYKMTNENLK